ncbi:uncharacterized protein LOC117109454 [Anneissia japonica]|uniref:uncharacterized protein LOC117109454 n=1 Tax=Anneissia japonica TaxID=1529436 RepID=UPI001425AEAC|nr:uncharacterized protein LOC117109454 [Anneissia japonica]
MALPDPLGRPVIEIIRDVVQDLIRDTGYGEGPRNAQLRNRIEALLHAYSGPELNNGHGSDIDFGDPLFRASYVYLYCTAHFHATFHGMTKFYEKHLLRDFFSVKFRTSSLRVCALGGGPGTDLFGLMMFLLRFTDNGNRPIRVKASIMDQYPAWENAFLAILKRIHKHLNMEVRYVEFDVNRQLGDDVSRELSNAKLVTMVKFISAVRMLPRAKDVLISAMNLLKPDTFIFYIDNFEGGNTEFVKEIASQTNIDICFTLPFSSNSPLLLPFNEDARILDELRGEIFRRDSQRQLRVHIMLLKKCRRTTRPTPRQHSPSASREFVWGVTNRQHRDVCSEDNRARERHPCSRTLSKPSIPPTSPSNIKPSSNLPTSPSNIKPSIPPIGLQSRSRPGARNLLYTLCALCFCVCIMLLVLVLAQK